MKIVMGLILAFATFLAHAGILTDMSGNPVMDGNGDCVRCESNTDANCDTKPPVFNTVNEATFQPDTAPPVSAPSISESACPSIKLVVQHDGYDVGYAQGRADGFAKGMVRNQKETNNTPACPEVAPVAASEPRPVFAPVKTEPECKQEITFVELILVGIIWLTIGIVCGRVSKR